MQFEARGLLSCALACGLASCFTKPDAPANSDAPRDASSDAPHDYHGTCHPLPTNAIFASYRNGAIGDLDGDALQDMAVFGVVAATPHVWVYHGARAGFDLACPDEDHTFLGWSAVAAIDIAKFPGRAGLLIVAGASIVADRAQFYVADYAIGGATYMETTAEFAATNGLPYWIPNADNHAAFIASRTTNDGMHQQIFAGGGDRTLSVTWNQDRSFSLYAEHGTPNQSIYQAVYSASGSFTAATSSVGAGAFARQARGDSGTNVPLVLTSAGYDGVGTDGVMGAVRHTSDEALLRSPRKGFTNGILHVVEVATPTSISQLRIPDVNPIMNMQIREVATRDTTPQSPLWILMGDYFQPELGHRLLMFRDVAKTTMGALLPTTNNAVAVDTSDIVKVAGHGEDNGPIMVAGQFDGNADSARVMWQTSTGMKARCYHFDGSAMVVEFPCH